MQDAQSAISGKLSPQRDFEAPCGDQFPDIAHCGSFLLQQRQKRASLVAEHAALQYPQEIFLALVHPPADDRPRLIDGERILKKAAQPAREAGVHLYIAENFHVEMSAYCNSRAAAAQLRF